MIFGWTFISALSLTAAFQHFSGLVLAAPLLGFAQWVTGRSRGLRPGWVTTTALGGWAGLVFVLAVEKLTGRLTAPAWSFLFGALAGIPPGWAQAWVLGATRDASRKHVLRMSLAHATLWGLFIAAAPWVGEAPIAFSTPAGPFAPPAFALRNVVAALVPSLVFGWLSLPSFALTEVSIASSKRWPAFALAASLLLWLAYDVTGTSRAMPEQTTEASNATESTASAGAKGDGWSEQRYRITVGAQSFNAYFFSPNGAQGPRPLVLYLHGSGFQSARGFTQRRVVPFAMSRKIFVATLDKVGVEPNAESTLTAEAEKHDTRASRIENASRFLDVLVAEYGSFDGIHIIGHSEGADVAAGLAASRSDLRTLTVLSGGGLGPADEARIGLKQLLSTPSATIDALNARFIDAYVFTVTMRILAKPSVDRYLLGLTYRRWASYLTHTPADDAVAFKGPVLSVHGDADINSPIETSRYLEQRFIEAGRANALTRRELAGVDHNFRDSNGADYLPEVIAGALDWMLAK
ncbi:MAG: hypothetical protein K1X64_11155 [Myxococcaceae bacterium]|nr:hypothetical protein [Myxococcaceae bacterium]